jgi:hypothetical protein
MRRSFSSAVQVRTNERIAALLAAYTPKLRVPLAAAAEPVRVMEAPSFRNGSAFLDREEQPLDVSVEGLVVVLLGDAS